MRLLITISVPVDCYMWACCGPEQLSHMGHFRACRMTCIGLLIAIYVPVDCHMWASCLPHMRLLSATCGPHVGQTTATRGPALQNARGPQLCLKWELFQLPHEGLAVELIIPSSLPIFIPGILLSHHVTPICFVTTIKPLLPSSVHVIHQLYTVYRVCFLRLRG